MEHILQTLLAIVFTFLAAKNLNSNSYRFLSVDSVSLLIIASLIPLTRYEGLFLVFAACLLFILRKRLLYAIALATSSLIPIVIYAFISISHGWLYLPNSIILKSNLKGTLPGISSWYGIKNLLGYSIYSTVTQIPQNAFPLVVMVVLAFVLFLHRVYEERCFWRMSQIILFMFFTAAMLHLEFASLGGIRYDAYLLALGLFAIAPPLFESLSRGIRKRNLLILAVLGITTVLLSIPDSISLVNTSRKFFVIYLLALCLFALVALFFIRPHKKTFRPSYYQYAMIAISFLLLALPAMDRSIKATTQVPNTTSKIYNQEYQTGLFINTYYSGQAVALNDIGAVNYLADIKCLDLWGLGSMKVAENFSSIDTDLIDDLAKSMDVKIAIIYDQLYTGKRAVPNHWIKVGEWELIKRGDDSFATDTISFYAVEPSEKNNLIMNLQQFGQRLPAGNNQSGLFTNKLYDKV